MKATLNADQLRWNKYLLPVIITVLLGLSGLFIYKTLTGRQAAPTQPAIPIISQDTLEEKYGLRVNLIGVTAAGGMVDLRIKILDAEKAKQLISDGKHLPSLVVSGSNVILTPSEDSQSQEIKLQNGGDLFLLFPNTRNAVQTGSSLTVRFADRDLEPIIAK